jgi:predicted transcriptional regulator
LNEILEAGARTKIAVDMTIHYTVIQETSMPTKRRSRAFTISMPPEMAASAQALAKQENRTMSELMREAFRAYHGQRIGAIFDEIGRYAATRNPQGYTEEDIPRLVKEVRAEMRAEREAKQALAAQ